MRASNAEIARAFALDAEDCREIECLLAQFCCVTCAHVEGCTRCTGPEDVCRDYTMHNEDAAELAA